MASSNFSLTGFLIRWVVAFVLVAATFNSTDYSLVGWLQTTGFDTDLPLKALLVIVLLIGYIIYLRATMRSLGIFGIALVVALIAVLGWVVASYAGTEWATGDILIWLGVAILSLILALGMSWSYVRRKMTGQLDVDETDS